jgi:hypothetical protein
MVRDDARASPTQGNAGAAVAVIVDQELRAERAGNGLIFKLEADAALAMRSREISICGCDDCGRRR